MNGINYNPKERIRLTRALFNPNAAVFDLQLLEKLQPTHSQLSIWSINPKRYADDILFSLLEVAPAEEIRLNRRNCSAGEQPKEETGKVPAESAQGQADGKADTTAEGSQVDPHQEGKADQETEDEELHETQAVADLKETQQRAEDAEIRADEAEKRAEEAEQRADEAEAAIAESKKKEPSRKKKSTRQ